MAKGGGGGGQRLKDYGDIQRGEWEGQPTKEVREAGWAVQRRRLSKDAGLWSWPGPVYLKKLGAVRATRFS